MKKLLAILVALNLALAGISAVAEEEKVTLSFLRIGTKGETLAVVVNFSGEAWPDYQVALPTGGKWTEVFTTDDAKYGGSDIHNGTFEAVEGEYHSRPFSAKITVPALGVVFLKPED